MVARDLHLTNSQDPGHSGAKYGKENKLGLVQMA